MKEKLKRFAVLVALHVVGVAVGSALSAPIHGLAFDGGDYLGSVVLAPFEMTIGIPIVFSHYSTLTGVLVSVGAIVSVWCFIRGMVKPAVRPRVGLVAGSILWSLGNTAVFCAFMSV